MDHRVALDADVCRLLMEALGWRGGPEPDAESVAAVRISVYAAAPLVTPTVAAEIEQAQDSVLANWRRHGFEEIGAPDDFYRGCVKGMAERYLDYHPDPRACRVVAEAECAKVEALLTLNTELVRGLGGKSEAIGLVRPSAYWRSVKLPHGAPPRIAPAGAFAGAGWWRW